MLEKIGPEIWFVDGVIVNFYGFAYPTRSVVVRLAEKKLWVWSSIVLSPELKRDIDTLGKVSHLVSPNKIHHLYLGEWRQSYPDALLWGPQSVVDKRLDLTFQSALEDWAPQPWSTDIAQFWFRGSSFMDEIVFFHKPSKTVILADLSENFSERFLQQHWRWWQRPIAKLWKITEGWGYAPLEWRLSFRRREAARAARDALLACDIDKVVMAHGEWQPTDGRAYLERALSWLG